MSRALGDLHLRPTGLISSPEFSTWRKLNREQDSFLVLVSDGATEALSAAQICQIAAATASGNSPSFHVWTGFPWLWLHEDSSVLRYHMMLHMCHLQCTHLVFKQHLFKAHHVRCLCAVLWAFSRAPKALCMACKVLDMAITETGCRAGKEAPITALPRAIPLLPVPSASSPAPPSGGAGTTVNSRDAEASAGDADGDTPDAVTGPSARHADSARHRPGLLVHAPVMPSLPGLVPRPLSLPEAVAEAITLAAYKQGSTDNLAALVVDLQPEWRASRQSREVLAEPQPASRGAIHGQRDRAGPELSGEGLPWHSTGLIEPQHGEGIHVLKVCLSHVRRDDSKILKVPCRTREMPHLFSSI